MSSGGGYGKQMSTGHSGEKKCWRGWVFCCAAVAAPFVYLLALPWVLLGLLLYPFVCPCHIWCKEGCWDANFYGFVKSAICCVCDMHKQLFDRPNLK